MDGLTAKLAEALSALESYRDRERRGVAEDSELFLAEREELREVLTPLMASGSWMSFDDGAVARPAALPEAGDEVGGFVLVREVGRGGMGIVYEAFDPRLGRRIALKFVRAELLHSDAARTRFQREARVLAPLSHPGLCRVHAFGEHLGTPWLAMEYLDGWSWSQHESWTRDPVEAWLRRFRDVAEALHFAHGAGAVHRDLKPSNLMTVAEDGRSVVLDFGLAGLEEAGDQALTGSLDRIGSPFYMSPEQVLGRGTDARTDVWGLGVTMYEVLTGRRPFDAVSDHGLQRAILEREPRRVDELRRDLPRDLGNVVATCLEKEPPRRYRDCAELAAELQRILDGEPVRARPIGRLEKVVRWCRRHPLPSGLAAGLAAALTVALVFALLAQRESARAADAVATAQREADRVRSLQAGSSMDLGHLAASRGDWDAAIEQYEIARGQGRPEPDVDVAIARVLIDGNRRQDALALLRELQQRTDLGPHRPVVDFLLADPTTVLVEESASKTMAELRRVAAGGGLAPADAALARSLLADDVEAALSAVEECLRFDPGHRAGNEILTSLRLLVDGGAVAWADAERFHGRFPADPVAAFYVALTRMMRGDAERARDLVPEVDLEPELEMVADAILALRRIVTDVYTGTVDQLMDLLVTGELPTTLPNLGSGFRALMTVNAGVRQLRDKLPATPLRVCPAVVRRLISGTATALNPAGPDPADLDEDSDAVLFYRASTLCFQEQRYAEAIELLDRIRPDRDLLGIAPTARRLKLVYLVFALRLERIELTSEVRGQFREAAQQFLDEASDPARTRSELYSCAMQIDDLPLAGELAFGWLAANPDDPEARRICDEVIAAWRGATAKTEDRQPSGK